MEGKVKPDYARVVGISTAAAQKELIPLAIISVLMPLVVGLVLQVEALGGFLAGIILSGQLLAVFMANAGGAWDNAKKSIEDEPRDLAANTGKGSERHKAGVVGDTVGDPLKDTAGPALNPMIKVVNLVSLIAAPIIVKYSKMTHRPGRGRGRPARRRSSGPSGRASGRPRRCSRRSRGAGSEEITLRPVCRHERMRSAPGRARGLLFGCRKVRLSHLLQFKDLVTLLLSTRNCSQA